MAFRRDVAYLDGCIPEYVDLNGEEFKRVVRLLEAVLPELVAAPSRVQWTGNAKELYASRLREAESLAHDLREAFTIAGPAIDRYGQALAVAKAKVADGDAAADALLALMSPLTRYQTSKFRANEALAQWEDLREVTTWTDAIAEHFLQDRIDQIRDSAERYYRSAAHLYDEARAIDSAARAECLDRLREALRRLPDFQANSLAANLIVKYVPGMAAEMDEAAAVDTGVRLPGQGVVPEYGGASGNLSELHMDLVQRAANVHFDGDSWDTLDSADWIFLGDAAAEHAFKLDWIKHYSPVIQAAAYEYGIPADVLAGVVYMEVGGKPMWIDDAVDFARQHNLYPGDPNDTSYGPLAVQVDTAAVAMGYDPAHLSDSQRSSIIASLKDPQQNIMITAKVLADAKDTTNFAYTQPGDMTFEQGQRLAAVYNGGPDWNGGHAQSYAQQYGQHVSEAAAALL